jgi:hypothetical protein
MDIINQEQRQKLRNLATKWMEFASLPVMQLRKKQWEAVKDLKAEKPMIFVETYTILDYVNKKEIINTDPYLRNIEMFMMEKIRHAEEIPDDIVLEPYIRIPWVLIISDYGVPIISQHAIDSGGNSLGYSYNHPIKKIEDLSKLKLRKRRIDSARTKFLKELLEDIMGDIIQIKTGGHDYFSEKDGDHEYLGTLYAGILQDLFKLIGNNNLFTWVYDSPDAIHKVMAFLRDDRIDHFKWMEKENLIFLNIDTYNMGMGSYGYVSDLPAKDYDGKKLRLKDCWGFADGQEIMGLSPQMFNEFFLPYLAEVTKIFGLLYFGCCESLQDRFEFIAKEMTNLRAVSVSGWSDLFKMGDLLSDKYVYSRKPIPAYISGDNPEWDLLKKDIKDTLLAAKKCTLEIIFRDIYTIHGDRSRLKRWVEMVKMLIGN